MSTRDEVAVEIAENLAGGDTWVELCEKFADDKLAEAWPEMYEKMSGVLSLVDDMAAMIRPELERADWD